MLSSGNGNGGTATKRPPMGGDGAAGWDEGASKFVVPQSVVAAISAPAAAANGPQSFETHPKHSSFERPAEGDYSQSAPPNQGDDFPPMRPPTPPMNHWSVRRTA